jgi:hypothetical protein
MPRLNKNKSLFKRKAPLGLPKVNLLLFRAKDKHENSVFKRYYTVPEFRVVGGVQMIVCI